MIPGGVPWQGDVGQLGGSSPPEEWRQKDQVPPLMAKLPLGRH